MYIKNLRYNKIRSSHRYSDDLATIVLDQILPNNYSSILIQRNEDLFIWILVFKDCLINEEYITTLHPDFSSHIFGTLFLIRKCNPQTFGDEFDSHQ
jgi:hypothetical protein